MTPYETAALTLVGANVRRVLPGSLTVAGTEASWTEKCGRRRCLHDGLCHMVRSAYLSPRAACYATRLRLGEVGA